MFHHMWGSVSKVSLQAKIRYYIKLTLKMSLGKSVYHILICQAQRLFFLQVLGDKALPLTEHQMKGQTYI